MLSSFDMRIANNAQFRRERNALDNGCTPISEDIINNIPRIRLFIDNDANKGLQELHRLVLYKAMNRKDRYLFGEVGILVDLSIIELGVKSIKSITYGEYSTVAVWSDRDYAETIRNNTNKEFYFIHNHPSGDTFSYRDILSFINTPNIYAMSVVGNNGNIYILEKGVLYNKNNVLNFLTGEYNNYLKKYNGDENKVKHKVVVNLLSQSERLGLDYTVRRSKNEKKIKRS